MRASSITLYRVLWKTLHLRGGPSKCNCGKNSADRYRCTVPPRAPYTIPRNNTGVPVTVLRQSSHAALKLQSEKHASGRATIQALHGHLARLLCQIANGAKDPRDLALPALTYPLPPPFKRWIRSQNEATAAASPTHASGTGMRDGKHSHDPLTGGVRWLGRAAKRVANPTKRARSRCGKRTEAGKGKIRRKAADREAATHQIH